jgi:xanthine dehydrogenase accessory factor
MQLTELIGEWKKRGGSAALCTVVQTRGSTPRSAGARMLVFPDGSISGTIGGGALEKSVIAEALKVIDSSRPVTSRHDLLHRHEMCCGGSMDVFIEPLMEKERLYVFGAGHTGQALARHALPLDFDVVLIDDRKETLDAVHMDGVSKLQLHYAQALAVLPFDRRTYVAIMTYSHPHDRDILAFCLRKPFAYLGMIGSERKVEMTRKMFAEGISATEEELSRVDMPMGMDIGAETPDEIAVSILAGMIRVRRKQQVTSTAGSATLKDPVE